MKKAWVVMLFSLGVLVIAFVVRASRMVAEPAVSRVPDLITPVEETVSASIICVAQSSSSDIYDDLKSGVVSGFKNAGYEEGDKIIFDFQNAQDNAATMKTIAENFSADDCAVIVPLGTIASQAVVKAMSNTPIVFGAVADPVSAGIVASTETPGGIITGTTLAAPHEEALDLIRKLAPSVKTIGIIYNPNDENARAAFEDVKKIADGVAVVAAQIKNNTDVVAAARSVESKVGAFYVIPDSMVVAAQNALIAFANEKKKPVITVDRALVEHGALAGVEIDYKKLGEQTARVALRVMSGTVAGSIPVSSVEEVLLYVNAKTAKAIGVTLPESILKTAAEVY